MGPYPSFSCCWDVYLDDSNASKDLRGVEGANRLLIGSAYGIAFQEQTPVPDEQDAPLGSVRLGDILIVLRCVLNAVQL